MEKIDKEFPSVYPTSGPQPRPKGTPSSPYKNNDKGPVNTLISSSAPKDGGYFLILDGPQLRTARALIEKHSDSFHAGFAKRIIIPNCTDDFSAMEAAIKADSTLWGIRLVNKPVGQAIDALAKLKVTISCLHLDYCSTLNGSKQGAAKNMVPRWDLQKLNALSFSKEAVLSLTLSERQKGGGVRLDAMKLIYPSIEKTEFQVVFDGTFHKMWLLILKFGKKKNPASVPSELRQKASPEQSKALIVQSKERAFVTEGRKQ